MTVNRSELRRKILSIRTTLRLINVFGVITCIIILYIIVWTNLIILFIFPLGIIIGMTFFIIYLPKKQKKLKEKIMQRERNDRGSY
ncbi:MAG: hypothetical protein ACFFA3_20285 [Promethearchaeota archaeon]